jgi:hypothetical protein
MKRLAPLLAAALLGTGCYHHHDDCDPSVTLQWDFRTADGVVVGCDFGDAHIRFVDVFVDDVPAVSFDCLAGAGTFVFPRGSRLFTVEGVDVSGVDASERIIYRDEFTVDGNRCGNQVIATRPAEGRVNVDYSTTFQPPPNFVGFIWFSVFDNIAGQVAATIDANVFPETYPYPGDVTFRLPVGAYTVDFMELRSAGALVRRACTSPTFTVVPGSAPGEQQFVPAAPVALDCF